MTPLNARIAERLRLHRNAQTMSRETLAALSKVSLRTICRVEDGADCHVSTLHRLAGGLGLTLTDLVKDPE